MRRLIGLIIVLLLIGFGLSFALLNAEPVVVDYYLGTASLPLSLALTLSLVIGALLGLLTASAILVRQRRKVARLRRQLGQADRELGELRKLPLRDAV